MSTTDALFVRGFSLLFGVKGSEPPAIVVLITVTCGEQDKIGWSSVLCFIQTKRISFLACS